MTDDCGCCATPAAAVPAQVANRPGLEAVAYRIGTFATFRKAITDEIARTPELAALRTRGSEDYTITAIEMWAAVADVLTFYQERIANEALLRTATLRDSVLRLVRLIGYELRPGAAATTQLAFTLEPGTTAPIPAGTRVQSVPGEGEKPQTFETLAALAADARLNRLRLFPHPDSAAPTSPGQTRAVAAPDPEALAAVAALAPNDCVMLYAPAATEVLAVKALAARDDLLAVEWAAPIEGSAFGAAFDAATAATRACRLGRTFRLFGFDAPDKIVLPERKVPADATTTYLTTARTNFTLHGDGTGATKVSLDARYPGLKAGATVLAVSGALGATVAIPFEIADAKELKVSRSATSDASGASLTAISGAVTQLTLTALTSKTLADLVVATDDIRDIVIHELVGPPLRFWPYAYADLVAAGEVYLSGRRAGWSAVEIGRLVEKGAYKAGTVIDVADLGPGRSMLLTDAKGVAPVAAKVEGASVAGSGVAFEPTPTDNATIAKIGLAADQVIPVTVLVSRTLGATVAFPNALYELVVALGDFPPQTIALDGTTLGGGAIANVCTALQDAIRAALPAAPTFAHAFVFPIADPAGFAFAVAAGVHGDRVAFAPSVNDPATVAALGLDAAHVRFLDGVASAALASLPSAVANGNVRVTRGIDAPQDLFIFAFTAINLPMQVAAAFGVTTKVAPDTRMIVLPALSRYEPRVFVRLALDLAAPVALEAATALALGNVAPASHGETIRNEIVGDGDAARAFQRFTLKKKPVTYVPDAVLGGATSSLNVLVNGVRWSEVPTLYGAKPTDQVYIARIADDATMSVQFGDGVTGARPDTGRQNIIARYRQGIGFAGRVGAGKLTTLLDRPTGVKGATNLRATDGGADPETMARARDAAPGTVRTFGRAVSLRDFEDSALTAGEVAKASATWVWNGERRAIHLTVAAQGGATFSADGLARIAATLLAERDPNHKLLVDNYAAVAVRIVASLVVDARCGNDQVLAAARAALLADMAFERRSFARPVYLSEIFAVLQAVDGVVAVDVDALDLKSTDPAFRAAHGVDPSMPQPQARLLMLPARPVGASGTVLPAELARVEVPAQDVTLHASGGLPS